MSLMIPDAADVLNSSKIENDFKIAQVLRIRKEIPKALIKYQRVCESLEVISTNNPGANMELKFIPLSLNEISGIYQEKKDLEKALAFMRCQTHFWEYILSNTPNRENENSSDAANGKEIKEHSLPDLFKEMHNCFDMKDTPPPPPHDPQDIIKKFEEAKKKQDEETARENMRKLNEILEERRRKLENSKWEQTIEWVSNHPIKLAIGALVFLGVFLIIALNCFEIEEHDPNKELKMLRDEAAAKQKAKREAEGANNQNQHHDHQKQPKMSQEELQKLQEMMEKLKKEQEDKYKDMKKSRKEL